MMLYCVTLETSNLDHKPIRKVFIEIADKEMFS